MVILELGANDILRGQSISEMKSNIGRIIEHLKARHTAVLLAGMEAPTNSGAEYRQELHRAFPELASKYNVPLIPFFLEGVAGEPSLNQSDGIHPNAAGANLITETVFRFLEPLIRDEKVKAGTSRH